MNYINVTSYINKPTFILGFGLGSSVGALVGYYMKHSDIYQQSHNISKCIVYGGLSGLITIYNPIIPVVLSGCVIYDKCYDYFSWNLNIDGFINNNKISDANEYYSKSLQSNDNYTNSVFSGYCTYDTPNISSKFARKDEDTQFWHKNLEEDDR